MSAEALTYPKQVRTLSQYLRDVEEIKVRFAKSWGQEVDVWFRGHPDTVWRLIPSVYRPGLAGGVEDEIRHDFQSRAYPFLGDQPTQPTTDWDWYFLMQHYGLPTRLLDWSENAVMGLYFALWEESGSDSAVWVLDPFWLNHRVSKYAQHLAFVESRIAKRYLAPPFGGRSLPKPPLAMQPPQKSTRLAAQRGTFTIFGSSRRALDDYREMRGHLVKIEVPRSARDKLRYELSSAGVTASTVFPELQALCKELKDNWYVT